MILQNLHFKQNDQGFTLVELMITLAMSGIIIAAIYSAYIIQQKTYYTQGQVVEMQQNIRAGLEMMVGEIRIATYDPDGKAGASIIDATSSRLEFTSNLNANIPDTDLLDADEHVTFCLNATAVGDADGCDDDGIADGTSGSLVRNGQAIAEGIQAIELYYILDDATEHLPPTKTLTPDFKKIQAVQITLLAVSSQRDPKYTNTETYVTGSGVNWTPTLLSGSAAGDNFRRRLLNTSVTIRNHGLN
jgi:type IV pilus assembly protein PilW